MKEHALDLKNWALQPDAMSFYPFLEGVVRVIDV
jgi:hypothetical protein